MQGQRRRHALELADPRRCGAAVAVAEIRGAEAALRGEPHEGVGGTGERWRPGVAEGEGIAAVAQAATDGTASLPVAF
ncbi:MAG TPA: hypothetical protein PLN91_01700, partial [Rhodanobacteraceae bacterium]|nr:hypothetical protein [Rhodanobacteraceae bacterium]